MSAVCLFSERTVSTLCTNNWGIHLTIFVRVTNIKKPTPPPIPDERGLCINENPSSVREQRKLPNQ